MLELGVDEITLVLQPTPDDAYDVNAQWINIAEKMIDTYAKKADFENILGNKITEPKAPAGYTIAYHYGTHNWYMAVAYNPEQRSMGVIVKFSAQALDYYTEHRNIKLYKMLHITTDDMYTARLSRIDLTADYMDEDIDVTEIYHSLIDRKVDIYDKFPGPSPDRPIYRRRNLKYSGFCVRDEIPTIYIGSSQSNAQARIYDKRREQIERKGSKLSKALASKNWTRFEIVLRDEYAHQMTDALSLIYTDNAYANLIASVIVQKFRFMIIENGLPDHETDYTQMLIDCIANDDFKLRTSSTKNYDLSRNIEYLYYGSGIMQTLYKVQEIWGRDAAWELLAHTLDLLDDYEPNDDCQRWLLQNANDYLKKHPTLWNFLEDNLTDVIEDKKQKKGLRVI